MTGTAKHLDYIDKIKALACVLVVLGHFVMSMDASNILPYNSITYWFKETVYLFHVQLFFLCSGFLYNYLNKNRNYKYGKFVIKKLITLGVPYFTFTTATVLMKIMAKDSVNTEADGLLYTLFINPTAPYWYLYVLFFLFLVIPPLKSKKTLTIVTVVSVVLKIIMVSNLLTGVNLPYFLTGIMNNSIWFIMGMWITPPEQKSGKKNLIFGVCGFTVFIVLSVLRCSLALENNKALSFILGLLAVASIYLLFSASSLKTDAVTKILIKYNLPIFLMHTIFAAGVRTVLFKLGINQWYIHIPVGLAATFIGPVIAGFIMNKTKYLDFFLYPIKTTNKLKLSKSNLNNN